MIGSLGVKLEREVIIIIVASVMHGLGGVSSVVGGSVAEWLWRYNVEALMLVWN